MKKFCSIFMCLAELLVDIMTSAEPQQSSHHCQIFVFDLCTTHTTKMQKLQQQEGVWRVKPKPSV